MASVLCLLQQHLQRASCNGLHAHSSQPVDALREHNRSYSLRRPRLKPTVTAMVHHQLHSHCIACGASLHSKQCLQDASRSQLQYPRRANISLCSSIPFAASIGCGRLLQQLVHLPAGSRLRTTSVIAATAMVTDDQGRGNQTPSVHQKLPQHRQPVADFTPMLEPPEPNTLPGPVAAADPRQPAAAAVTATAAVCDLQQLQQAHHTAATGTNSNHSTAHQRQQQQQQQPSNLQRPPGMSSGTLRQMLQQQIQAATSWQQLQQLLDGRRDQLTLKHMSQMVVQVARLQAAEQRRWQQQLQQQQRYRQYSTSSTNSSSVSRAPPPTPSDLLQAATAGAAAQGLEVFLAELAAAVHAVLLKEQSEMIGRLVEKTAAAAAEGGSSSSSMASAADASSSSHRPSSHKFRHAPGPLSSYLADTIWGFAKLNHTPQDETMLLLWVEAFACVAAAADAVSFSQVIWGLGQLGFWPGEDVLDTLSVELGRRSAAAAAVGGAYTSSSEGLAVAAQCLNSSSSSSSSSSDHLTIQDQQLISCRALSNILWAFAVLGYTPPPQTLTRVWEGSVQGFADASPQALSNMIWAVAVLEITPSQQWMESWQDVALAGLEQQRWSCVDVANAAWAVGKFAGNMRQRPLVPPLPWRLCLMRAARVAAAGKGSSATAAAPRELVAVAWGLTAAGVAFSKTFTERLLLGGAAQRIHFKAREWCALLSVLAKQGVTPPVAWQRASHAVMQQRLRFFSARDFAAAAWALPQLGVEPRLAWKERFFAESFGQLFFLSPSSCCALVWGLGRLRWRPPRDWQDRLFLETYTKLAGFRAGELAGTLHGLAQLQLQPPVQWMWQATAVMALAAADMSTQELTTCLWALCQLRYRPPEPWLAALAERGVALLPAAWQQDGSSSGEGAAALQQQQQQRADAEGADLRRRRQHLLQEIKQLQQLQRQQPPQRSLYSVQQQQQQQQRQQQSLLQLRGDLELLEQRMSKQLHTLSAISIAAQQEGRQQQQQQQQPAEDKDPHDTAGEHAPKLQQQQQQHRQQQQQQQRCLGAGDVKVVLASLAQLQYTLPGDHPLMAAAGRLRIRASSSSKHRIVSSNSVAKAAAAATASDGTSNAQQMFFDSTDGGAADHSAGAAAAAAAGGGVASITTPAAAPVDDDCDSDIFCPAGSAAAVSSDRFLIDSSSSGETSNRVGSRSRGGHALHVAAKSALARRRRHGRRYSPQSSQYGEAESSSVDLG